MILLDTSAVIWLQAGHPRTRALGRGTVRLHLSPVTLLELQLLVEVGRLRAGVPLSQVEADRRWTLDRPGSVDLLREATSLPWTRDPFDRLLVAHARLRRWRLATADTHLLEHLSSSELVKL